MPHFRTRFTAPLMVTAAALVTSVLFAADPAAPATRPANRAPSTQRAPVDPKLFYGPDELPGKGLAQHDFLYTGEFDTRFPVQYVRVIKGGKIVDTYTIPTNITRSDGKRDLSEFDDIHLLSNGDLVYACKTGAGRLDRNHNLIWELQCLPNFECHSCQPIDLDRVFVCINGLPPRCMIVNTRTNKVEMEHELPCKDPTSQPGVHGQFRHIRMTKDGTYLIAALGMGKVFEYDKEWNKIWECTAPSVWAAVRLPNGNTLISGNQNGFVREVNKAGETVWEVKRDELPGIWINNCQEADRLPNGNTVICNWNGGGGTKKASPQMIEVTPEKKVVWVLREWENPDLGTASCFQLLDEGAGRAEVPGELLR